ncbi:hypothetical protein BDW75DRAFT_223052 [Aspergillus navahoensis]
MHAFVTQPRPGKMLSTGHSSLVKAPWKVDPQAPIMSVAGPVACMTAPALLSSLVRLGEGVRNARMGWTE